MRPFRGDFQRAVSHFDLDIVGMDMGKAGFDFAKANPWPRFLGSTFRLILYFGGMTKRIEFLYTNCFEV